MATPTFCCGFECGAGGGAGQHWNFLGSIAPTFNTNASFVRSGARSLSVSYTTNNGIARRIVASSTILVHRFYIYFSTLPNANTAILSSTNAGAYPNIGVMFKQSDGKIYAGSVTALATFSFGATGVEVTASRWYRIDCKINVSANPWTVDVQVDGTACGQYTNAVAASIRSTVDIGSTTAESVTTTYYIDDFIESETAADYPIGAGYINHFVPTSDGTHTATTTTIVKGTIATPVGGNVAGSTDVFNWVNGVPLLGGATDNTRLVNQQTAASTLYAEEIFGPAPGISTPAIAPRSVEVITADRQASTASGGFSTKLNDNGTENVIITRSGSGVITDRYVTKQYATMVGGGAWTVARFNALRARFGYSADATPDQYWRGIMIEAEFADVLKQKIIQVKQAVNRANTY